jgi:stage V sporulation protein AD
MARRIGKYTVALDSRPVIISSASAVGTKEGDGPMAQYFDYIADDDLMESKTWEQAESLFQKTAVQLALKKARLAANEIDEIFAGDLLNQCIGSTFGLREFQIPMLGLFGACSTMSLSLITAATAVDSGAARRAVAVTSSHFCSAERQFRFPLDYGGVRPPTSQWTVTGSGAAIVAASGSGPHIEAYTVGRAVDYKISDANNMGAAMAPAAADTITRYLEDTGTKPTDYDFIVTGDLGAVGSKLLFELMDADKIDISKVHRDCGVMMFDMSRQDVHSGGSGCGCIASIFCSYFMQRLKEGSIKNILLCATGALMSTTSSQQGESIPGICHLLHIKG